MKNVTLGSLPLGTRAASLHRSSEGRVANEKMSAIIYLDVHFKCTVTDYLSIV